MKFVDPTEPYRKFGSRGFQQKKPTKHINQGAVLNFNTNSRTSLNPTVQSRSENAL
jgi:hypothetical protein